MGCMDTMTMSDQYHLAAQYGHVTACPVLPLTAFRSMHLRILKVVPIISPHNTGSGNVYTTMQ